MNNGFFSSADWMMMQGNHSDSCISILKARVPSHQMQPKRQHFPLFYRHLLVILGHQTYFSWRAVIFVLLSDSNCTIF